MKLFGSFHLKARILDLFKSFPMECVTGLVLFAVFCISEVPETAIEWNYILYFTPAIFVAVYSANRIFSHANAKWIYYAVFPAMAIVFGLTFYRLGKFIDSAGYPVLLILAAIVFLTHRQPNDNSEFSRRLLQRVLNAFFAMGIGLLTLLFVVLIVFSINYIFSLKIDSFLDYVAAFIFLCEIPLLLCLLQKDSESKNWSTPANVLRIACNYVLHPAIAIYTVILYLYAISILVNWELPKGDISYMVFAFFMVAFAGMTMQVIAAKPVFKAFYRYFTYIAIPPLCLFWMGALCRIQMYGFTEMRVYLIVCGLIVTLCTASLLWKRASFRYMLSFAGIAIALFTYIPKISANDIGIMSQANRMKEIAVSLNLCDKRDGKLAHTAEFVATDSIAASRANELSEAYKYLARELGEAETRQRYGENELPEKYRNRNYSPPINHFYLRSVTSIDISEYQTCVRGDFAISPNVIRIDNRQISCDFKKHFAPYHKLFDQTEDYGELGTTSPFILKTDSCMIVFSSIDYNTETEECKFDVWAVFFK